MKFRKKNSNFESNNGYQNPNNIGYQNPNNNGYQNEGYQNPNNNGYQNNGYQNQNNNGYQNNGYPNQQNQMNYNNQNNYQPQQPMTSTASIPYNENFGPAAVKIIRKEKFFHIILFFFWFVLLIAAVFTALIFYLVSQKIIGSNSIIEYFQKNIIGWYVLLGIIGFPAFIGTIWNIIQINSWISTQKKLKLNNRYDDASVAFKFGDVYRKQALRNISVKWLFIAIFTYYGLFIAIIVGFSYIPEIKVDKPPFKFDVDIAQRLKDTFGNITIFASINGAVLASITVIVILYVVFNNKYIMRLRDFLGPNGHETVKNVDERKISKNKALRRIYIVSILILIILPIFILGIFVWRFIRRKRKK